MLATTDSTLKEHIGRSWNREYPSIMDLNRDVVKSVKEAKGDVLENDEGDSVVMKMEEFHDRVRECKEYMLCCKIELSDGVRCPQL